MSSVLETFAVVFSAETDKLEDGIKKAQKSTDDLNKSLHKSDEISKNLGSSFSSMIQAATGALAAFISVGAITAGIKSAIEYTKEIGNISDALGVSTEEVDMWSGAITRSGGSMQGFASFAKSMNSSLIEFSRTGTGATIPFFNQLGISLTDASGKTKKVTQLLPELADRFSKISKAKALTIGEKLGLDQKTILMLAQGRAKVDELLKKQKEYGLVSEKNKEQSIAFSNELSNLQANFRGIFLNASSYVLPALTKILEVFEGVINYIKDHSKLAEGALIAIGTVISSFLIPSLVRAAIAAAVAFAPFYLITGIITGLAAIFTLLYEDISAFMNGQNSLVGDMINKWPILGQIIRGIGHIFEILWDLLKSLVDFMAGMFSNPIQAIKDFGSNLSAIFDKILDYFPGLKKGIEFVKQGFESAGKGIVRMWDTVSSYIKSAIDFIMGYINKVIGLFQKVKGYFTGSNNKDIQANQTLEVTQKKLNEASNSPLNSQTSGSISNSNKTLSKNTSVNVDNINIHTQASNPNEISSQISSTLQDEMSRVISNSDDGVMA